MIDGCSLKYKGKSLFLAVFLNIYLPSLGYLYLDKSIWQKKWKICIPIVLWYIFIFINLGIFHGAPINNLSQLNEIILLIYVCLSFFLLIYTLIDIWNVSTNGNPLKLKNPILGFILALYLPCSNYFYADYGNRLFKYFKLSFMLIIIFVTIKIHQFLLVFSSYHLYTIFDSYINLKNKNLEIIEKNSLYKTINNIGN